MISVKRMPKWEIDVFDLVCKYAAKDFSSPRDYIDFRASNSSVTRAVALVKRMAARFGYLVEVGDSEVAQIKDWLLATKGEVKYAGTWDYWRGINCVVKKGERARSHDSNGASLFEWNQVVPQGGGSGYKYSTRQMRATRPSFSRNIDWQSSEEGFCTVLGHCTTGDDDWG